MGLFMKKLFFVLALFAISITSAFSQPIKQRSMDELLPFDPNVKIGVLDNGLKYYIRHNKLPENRAELRLVVKAGSVQEDDDQQGLAHFIEHMCFNGTKNFPKNALVNFLEETGMRFGADINANTGFDRTYYLLTIPLDKPGLLERGLQVLEDWAHNVTFDPEELEKERGVILEEWRLYRGAQERVMKQHYPYIFKDSKYAERLPIGDTAVILNAPRETFLRFYKEWYRPDLMAVVAVGEFDVIEVEKMIREKFSRIQMPENFRPRVEYPIPPHKGMLVSIAKDPELPMPNISVIYKFPGRDQSTFGGYRQGIIDNLINQMINMRIQEIMRKPNPPFLYAGAGVGDFMAGLAAFNVVSVSKTDDILKGLEAVLTEAYRMKQFGFTKSELERAKESMLKNMESALKEKDKTKSADYADEYFRNFYEKEGMPGIEFEYQLYQEFIPTITLEEVNKYAQALVAEDNKVVLVSVPDKPEIKVPTEQEIRSLYTKVSTAKLEPYKDDATDKPLMSKLPKPGKIVEEKKTGKFDIIEMKLSNGARVLAKKTDFKNDEVLFRAWSPGGTSLAKDEDYLSAMFAADIIDEGGISEFSATQLQKMLTGKIINISPSIDELTEGFSGSYAPNDAETFFQLLHLYFTAPRKDEETFKALVSRQREAIRNSKRRPETVFQDTVTAVLFGYHPRYMPLNAKDMDKVNLDKAVEFFKDRFADASDFTFIFVGNFDLKELKKYIETYIASLPSKKRNEKWRDLGVNYAKGPLTKEVVKGIEPKSSVRLTIADNFDYNPDNILKFNAMMEVFNIRLREVIREDKGGVYGIRAIHRVNQYPNPRYTISIVFGTGPTRVEELINSAFEVIDEVQKQDVSDENFTKVKEILKREFETNQKENQFWLSYIYNSDYNKLDVGRLAKYTENVDKLTKNDIKEAAKKYLKKDKVMRFILNPEQ
jgi:zinc protease